MLTPTKASSSLSRPPPSVCSIRLHARKSSRAPGEALSRCCDTRAEKKWICLPLQKPLIPCPDLPHLYVASGYMPESPAVHQARLCRGAVTPEPRRNPAQTGSLTHFLWSKLEAEIDVPCYEKLISTFIFAT